MRSPLARLSASAAASAVDWFSRDSYRWFLPIQTRWKDNDPFGHVNNAVHHSVFDSAINVYLIRNCGLDIVTKKSPVGYMVQTECVYKRAIQYPDVYVAGLAVCRLGRSSVTYRTGLFPLSEGTSSLELDLVRGHMGQLPEAAASLIGAESVCAGSYTHVFVDPATERPVDALPDEMRGPLEALLVSAAPPPPKE